MKRSFREILCMILGCFLIASAVYLFMRPSHISVGSISGLSMVLTNFIPLPLSAISFLLNLFLLILSFLFLGKDFGTNTAFCSLVMPAFLALYEVVLPGFQSITQDPLLDMLCYILVVSAGQTLLFSINATSGGMDVVIMLMNRYLRMDLGKAMSLAGMAVALSSALCYDSKTVVLSVVGTYFSGIIMDYFIFGYNIKRRVCVISSKVEEIASYLLYELHSGATYYDSIGAFDLTHRLELVTIVNKQEYRKLMAFIRKTDPTAFVTVYSVNEVIYQPKIKQK